MIARVEARRIVAPLGEGEARIPALARLGDGRTVLFYDERPAPAAGEGSDFNGLTMASDLPNPNRIRWMERGDSGLWSDPRPLPQGAPRGRSRRPSRPARASCPFVPRPRDARSPRRFLLHGCSPRISFRTAPQVDGLRCFGGALLRRRGAGNRISQPARPDPDAHRGGSRLGARHGSLRSFPGLPSDTPSVFDGAGSSAYGSYI